MAISITSSAIANWRFYRERTINFFKDRHYLREVPWMDPTRAPWWLYTHIHPAQWEYIYIWEYNAWVCDVIFQNGDFKGKGLRMSRWVSDCGGQEEVLSASTSGSFPVAISTAMFWRWGHGMGDESSWIVELPHRFILQVKLWWNDGVSALQIFHGIFSDLPSGNLT
jgi:hypothetical protein